MMVSKFRVLTLFTFLTGGLTACNGVPTEPGSEEIGLGGAATTGGAENGGSESTGGTGGWGGGTETGGASTGGGSSCEGPARPPQAYLCAGSVSEREVLGFNWAVLQPTPYYYACGYDYGSGGYPGAGGSPATGGEPGSGGVAGGSTGGLTGYIDDKPGDVDYDDYGPYPETGGSGPIAPPNTGGGFMGGAGGEGGSEATGGISSTGGTGPMPEPPSNGWCDGLNSGSIVGVSYAVGPCTQTQLRTPLRFQEPDGWYTLRVYAGNEACERGTLLYETAGYGVGGAEVEVPVYFSDDVFASIELTTEEYWYSSEPAIELLPLPGNE